MRLELPGAQPVKSSETVMPFPRRPAPPMMRLRQKLPSDHIEDVHGHVHRKLMESGLPRKVTSGKRIAITAGSRGIGGLDELLSGISGAVRECGGGPFNDPA